MMATTMKNLVKISLVVIAGGASCATAYTRGTYEDPNQIEMLSDDFNENDLQLIAKKIVGSLQESKQLTEIQGKPVLLVGKWKNSTSEHIDLKSLSDKVQVQLTKLGKFQFMDKGAREELAEEYEFQGSGYVNPDKAKGRGNQASADYLFSGEISSIVQEVGSDKLVYYKLTGKLHNIKSGIVEWTDEKELRKKFKKKGVGF